MALRKKILFVVNKKNYNVFNRNSAIDSILCSILLDLSKDHEVWVNGKILKQDLVYNSSAISKLSSTSFLKRNVPGFIKQFLSDLKVIKDNKSMFEEISKTPKPDIIIELMRYGSELGSKLKEHFNVPLIAYFDAPAIEENRYLTGRSSLFYKFFHACENRTIKMADKVIVYSSAITDYWTKRIPGIDINKFEIFQTLDYSRLTFIENKQYGSPLTIGFVGSFLKWHRVENLVKAFENLRKKGFKANLLLIGAGEEYEAIKRQVSVSTYKEDIIMTGFIDGDKLIEFRNRIDIGVMPGTHWYCMPTKVFEYGASRIASLAPGTESIRRMFVENDEVVFLNDFTADELERELSKLIQTPSQIEKLARNLQNKIFKNNSIDVAGEFYRNLISKLTIK